MDYVVLLCLGALVSICSAVKYEIKVYTGDVWSAGTDANVRITLYGSLGNTPAILLDSDDNDFERGSVRSYFVDTVDVGTLSKIKMQHDNSAWIYNDWYLQKVEVRYYGTPKFTVFECNTWISKSAGLSKIFHTKESCGVTSLSSSRIVGGQEARAGAWPWQVSVDYYQDYGGGNRRWRGHWCGASIVSERWIISAAHCFSDEPNRNYYKITAGEHNLRSSEGYEQVLPIEKLILHEYYDKYSHDYDIALIKLKDPIKYSDRALPVCLPSAGDDQLAGTQCFITGWGALSEGGSGPAVLHQAKVPLVSRDTCKKMYANYGMTITQHMRCAGFVDGGIDSCQGDSGGPMVCNVNGKWHLFGAVSWGVGCARRGVYGVYADIVNLKDWLSVNMV